MKWYQLSPHSSERYPSLRAACLAWGLTRRFGKRIEAGVYAIRNPRPGFHDVYFVREDKLSDYEYGGKKNHIVQERRANHGI